MVAVNQGMKNIGECVNSGLIRRRAYHLLTTLRKLLKI